MPDNIAETLHELIVATRILANENVLDAFGRVGVRHPDDPQRFFIPRHRAPELAEVSDIVELDLDFQPVRPTEFRLYSERVIHGEIYKARPEVNAVVHHHAHAVLPFANRDSKWCRFSTLRPRWVRVRSGIGATSSAAPTCGGQAGGRRVAARALGSTGSC